MQRLLSFFSLVMRTFTMRNIILTILCIIPIFLHSQSISNNWFNVSENINFGTECIANSDIDELQPIEEGINMVWDFSFLESNGYKDHWIYVEGQPYNPDSTIDYDIALNLNNNQIHFHSTNYYKIFENKVELFANESLFNAGNSTSQYSSIYTDPKIIMQLPYSFNESISDDFEYNRNITSTTYDDYDNEIVSDTTEYVAESFTIEFKGYGTLHMPYGVYDNCALFKYIENGTNTHYKIYNEFIFIPYVEIFENSVCFLNEPIDIVTSNQEINNPLNSTTLSISNNNLVLTIANKPIFAEIQLYSIDGKLVSTTTTQLRSGTNNIPIKQKLAKQQYQIVVLDKNTGFFKGFKVINI